MKTQHEIESVKDKLSEEISELSTLISNARDLQEVQFLSQKIRIKQAQYNILIEVLK